VPAWRRWRGGAGVQRACADARPQRRGPKPSLSFSLPLVFPQVFVRGEFVGGSDVLMEMHNSGEMAKLVESLEGDGGAAK
jgi:hypothetical protein